MGSCGSGYTWFRVIMGECKFAPVRGGSLVTHFSINSPIVIGWPVTGCRDSHSFCIFWWVSFDALFVGGCLKANIFWGGGVGGYPLGEVVFFFKGAVPPLSCF